MLYIARGIALLISSGTTYPRPRRQRGAGQPGLRCIGGGRILGIPTAIWIMVVFAIVAAFVLTKTPFGRWVYAAGGNERAAELSGVPVRRSICAST